MDGESHNHLHKGDSLMGFVKDFKRRSKLQALDMNFNLLVNIVNELSRRLSKLEEEIHPKQPIVSPSEEPK